MREEVRVAIVIYTRLVSLGWADSDLVLCLQ